MRTAYQSDLSDEEWELGAVLPFLTRLGVIRLTNYYPAHPDLPSQQRAQIEAFNSSTQHVVTTVEEFRATPETTAQVRITQSVGDIPLAVVSAGEQPSSWLEMQDELATLSPRAVFIMKAPAATRSRSGRRNRGRPPRSRPTMLYHWLQRASQSSWPWPSSIESSPSRRLPLWG